MNTDLMFSSKSDNWSTPKDFYDKLNREFNFTFDPCPLGLTINEYDADGNLTRSDTIPRFDGLSLSWNGSIFINPPYSNIRVFLEKGINSVLYGNATVCVFLVPARTDTKWFHELIYLHEGWEVRFIKGRLKFGDGKNSAPFPSMLCIYRGVA
jgi:phage N-6-adenine-methyltransferase